jgi:hypothetical protein
LTHVAFDFVESDDELNIVSSKVAIPKSDDDNKLKEDSNIPYDPIHSTDLCDAELSDLEDTGEFEEGEIDSEEEAELDELDVMLDKEEVPVVNYSFMPIHPQFETHRVRMKKEDELVVPNFIPNTLPRSDRGDREYYCCTMLTLFKPWRVGLDLKKRLDSWDKTFVGHEFSKRLPFGSSMATSDPGGGDDVAPSHSPSSSSAPSSRSRSLRKTVPPTKEEALRWLAGV